ncbi:hypothetical protein [Brevibacillus migulae]|uniref:hypothetical protein n=1 Tax=Brevibacillus migulae TaxID=1644114 RepID=UPI00196A6E54|nr:hypothetical protein [Brevibacillus migulae]
MPRLQTANNAQTTLTASLTAAATSFTVTNAASFPNAPFRITIDGEIMEVGAINKSTNTFSSVQRGLEGTTAATHNAGAFVENRFTSGTYGELVDSSQLSNYALKTDKKTVRFGHTYAIPGDIKVASGDTDYIIPFFVSLASGQTAKFAKVRARINSGTSVTCYIKRNGADMFGPANVTQTATDWDVTDVDLSNNDMLQLVVTAVSGSPKNLSFTIFIDYTQ